MQEGGLPAVRLAASNSDRVAIVDERGEHTYAELLSAAMRVASTLLGDSTDLKESRVAFMVGPSFEYAAVLWGIWMAGGIAVPLCVTHPHAELQYVAEDSGTDVIVATAGLANKLRPIADANNCRLVLVGQAWSGAQMLLPTVAADRRALILYTSGTTSRPKRVVHTHRSIAAQIASLVEAWGWTADDRILLVLPLHHIHGIVNVLLCSLWVGATCEILPRSDADDVWDLFKNRGLTLFMAVPTIYVRLISAWEKASTRERDEMSQACATLRLMVSGSAALPVSVFEKWQAITGHTMLERYGMTEIGMALSNPLDGVRRPGYVGVPLPGVEARLVDESGREIVEDGQPGEIQVRGPNVFREYWGKPECTRVSFRDGWFCTGDVAVINKGSYRILGRNSVDIIKTGGYKVSAFEIEEAMRTHPSIAECAVVGVADPEWGERVCAAVILEAGASLTLKELRAWAKARLAAYKVPTRLLCVDELPRNVMGKVTKPEVKTLFR
jgi:malonyl-CoA/methylmalonyl-CoA synthetase